MSWLIFLINTSLRNLWRAPRRTIVSLLAIAAASGSILVMQAFIDGVTRTFRRNVITAEIGHYQIFKKGYRNDDQDDPFAYQIENLPEMRQDIEEQVGKLTFFSGHQRFFGLLSLNERSLGGRGIGIDAQEDKKFLTLAKVKDGKHLADS